MDKSEILKELHMMIDSRLFGRYPWPVDRETVSVLENKLLLMGLDEVVSSDTKTRRVTILGKELQLDLIMVFVGLWDEWEMPSILEKYGLIDESEREQLYDQLDIGRDPEFAMRSIVQKAYLKHYNPFHILN